MVLPSSKWEGWPVSKMTVLIRNSEQSNTEASPTPKGSCIDIWLTDCLVGWSFVSLLNNITLWCSNLSNVLPTHSTFGQSFELEKVFLSAVAANALHSTHGRYFFIFPCTKQIDWVNELIPTKDNSIIVVLEGCRIWLGGLHAAHRLCNGHPSSKIVNFVLSVICQLLIALI